jgi:hypothetical protein
MTKIENNMEVSILPNIRAERQILRIAALHDQKKMLVEHLIPKSWALIWSWSPFAAIIASTLRGRALL